MLPAYAGMIRQHTVEVDGADRAPRVCGDDPNATRAPGSLVACSPRMRG